MFDYLSEFKGKGNVENVMRQSSIIDDMINAISQIIVIDNFPTDLNYRKMIIKNILLGKSALLKIDNNFYIGTVQEVGLKRKDERPNKVNITYISDDNEIHVVEKTNDIDCVLWYHTDTAQADVFIKYLSYQLTEIEMSMLAVTRHTRHRPMLRVKDEIEKEQINKAIKDSDDGKIATFISDRTFEDLLEKKSDYILNITDVDKADKIQYLSHFYLDMENRFYNRYGLPVYSTGKMQQQTEKEISGRELTSWLMPQMMLIQAHEFCERANKLYGLNLQAHYGILHEYSYNKMLKSCSKEDVKDDYCNHEKDGELNED